MSRFSARSRSVALPQTRDATTNHAGGLAFTNKHETELYKLVCTSLLQDKYYAPLSSEYVRLIELITACEPSFVLKLASYARTAMKMRSIPVVLLVEVAVRHKNVGTRQYVPRVVRRADKFAEIIAYYIKFHGEGKINKFPNSLRRGMADALESRKEGDEYVFTEYHFAKYKRSGHDIGLVDVVNIVRPKPATRERSRLYQRLLTNSLNPARTWETTVSAQGSTREVWEDVSKDMGIMALIRNIRNFTEKGATAALDEVVRACNSRDRVLGSRMLPHRWYMALRAAKMAGASGRVLSALSNAMDTSVESVPEFEGATAILVDLSGSMSNRLSGKSRMTYLGVSSLFGAILKKKNPDSQVVAFGSTAKVVHLNPSDSILTMATHIESERVGHATYAGKAVQLLSGNKFDRLILLSDMQVYGSDCAPEFVMSLQSYRREVNSGCYLYSIDLAGMVNSVAPETNPKNILLAGWSERLFDLIPAIEGEVDAVENIKRNW